MQRKPIQDRLQRAKNRDEYLLLFPFSAPCVGVARAAFVARVTSVLGASTWVLVRTSARGSHSESKTGCARACSRPLEKGWARAANRSCSLAQHACSRARTYHVVHAHVLVMGLLPLRARRPMVTAAESFARATLHCLNAWRSTLARSQPRDSARRKSVRIITTSVT